MNLLSIFKQIETVDPEVYEKLDTRRDSLRSFTRIGGKLALTAIPLAFGGLFKKAYGQTTSGNIIIDTLNFALTLEFLESEFYKQASATNLFPTDAAKGAFTKITADEVAHVNFLKTAISGAGGTPVAFTADSFDFTAGGLFPTVFTNYDVMLAVAQTFEDTGVRAYKGQAGNLITDNGVLSAALQIHSVEARHASHLRQMRNARGDSATKPWITLKDRGTLPAEVQASYDGEEVTMQTPLDITSFDGVGGKISANAASEAFDEILTKDQVNAIVAPFFK